MRPGSPLIVCHGNSTHDHRSSLARQISQVFDRSELRERPEDIRIYIKASNVDLRGELPDQRLRHFPIGLRLSSYLSRLDEIGRSSYEIR